MPKAALSATWHYPPDLLELVVDAVARLNRGKDQEIDFFRGAGVPESYLQDVAQRVATDRDRINKFEIARTVLVRLNEAGEAMLRPRREILKRIVETESFEHCWPNDRLAAKGVVAEIRTVIQAKDSFARMKSERDKERETHLAAKRQEHEDRERQRRTRAKVKVDLFALFSEKDPWKRGKQLESVLNRLFVLDGLSVREAFHLNGDEAEGIVEQIDGVVDLDGQLYLVEMKMAHGEGEPKRARVASIARLSPPRCERHVHLSLRLYRTRDFSYEARSHEDGVRAVRARRGRAPARAGR